MTPTEAMNYILKQEGIFMVKALAIVMRDSYNRGLEAAAEIPEQYAESHHSFMKDVSEKIRELKVQL